MEICEGILNLIQGNSLYIKKLAEKASLLICPPLRSRLWGVTERGFKGEADEDPCGRVLGPPPFYGVVMSMTLTYTR